MLDEEAMTTLAVAFRIGRLPALEKLLLTQNKLGGRGLNALALAIGDGACEKLQRLELSANDISSEGVQAFAQALHAREGKPTPMPALAHLNFGDNNLGDAAVEALVAAAGEGALAGLKTLVLERNAIGDGGLRALADGVSRMRLSALTTLSMSYNPVGDKGVSALASAVSCGDAACPGTHTFFAKALMGGKCKYCKASAEEHAPRRGGLPALKELSLTYTQVDDTGLSALADALSAGAGLPALKTLYVDDGPSGAEHEKLQSACASRSIALP